MERSFTFFSAEHHGREPYIQEFIDYTLDGANGYIHFNGYYYVPDEEFPKRIFFITGLNEVVASEEGYTKYELQDAHMYEVDIFKRDIVRKTDQISEIEDEDGTPMRVCFFPTNEQKLHFRVLNEFKSQEALYDRIKESKDTHRESSHDE